MASEQEIAKAKALLEQAGFVVRQPSDNDWKRFGAVITCNLIAPGLTEKKFVKMIENALHVLFITRDRLGLALDHEIVQMGPLHVKSYARVKAGLRRKGEDLADD